MAAFAPVFSSRIGCQYRFPKKRASRTKTMLTVLARVGFLFAVSFIGGALLGLISLQSETRAAKVVAAKRKASAKAAKRAAAYRLAGNLH